MPAADPLPSLAPLLARGDARPRPGLAAADILAAEREFGRPLPAAVAEFYRRADGAEFPARGFSLLPLADAVPYAAYLPGPGWGYLPVTENNDSNPLCVCCTGPLAGHVVHVFHDDAPRLKFRHLDELFRALPWYLGGDAGPGGDRRLLDHLPSPFDGPARTADDRRVGREVLALAGPPGPDGPEPHTAARFGVTLLGEDDVDEVARLLGHEDEYVRHAAAERLGGMATPLAAAAVAAYRQEFREFAERVAAELTAAGLRATLSRGHDGRPQVRVDPGPVWLNLDSFFGWRDRPDGFGAIVRRARELVELNRRP